MSFDGAQFKRIERAGYDRLGSRYLAAAATRHEIATALLDAASLAPGQRVLDLASGPGLLARAAAAHVGDAAWCLPATSARASWPAARIWRAWRPTAKPCP
jgi:cyclopropane fatty-acyl-phospholipid synthase-like methyltransferase